ncbi:MAG: hypothetical protein GF411_03670 [Candidatus Lokiarchaeota archaeon]|nr:hypothetical protein [Candidatus Lokiarchaeota archaeon]
MSMLNRIEMEFEHTHEHTTESKKNPVERILGGELEIEQVKESKRLAILEWLQLTGNTDIDIEKDIDKFILKKRNQANERLYHRMKNPPDLGSIVTPLGRSQIYEDID